MDKVPIKELKDIILVENCIDGTIQKGSALFCGCCGEKLGTLTEEITFPFISNDLVKKLENITFTEHHIGLTHKTCGHTMFSFRDWAFTSVDSYLQHFYKPQENGPVS